MKEAESYLRDAKSVVFADYTGVPAEDLRRLRREVDARDGKFLAIKKRVFKVLAKEKHLAVDVMQYPAALGVIFGKEDMQSIAAPIVKFYNELGGTDKEKKAANVKKVLGGYEVSINTEVPASYVLMLGQLPSREVLLAQFLGILSAPVRAFLYILDQKSKQT